MKRKRKIRTKVKGTRARPRLSVFRSNKAIYAQVIDDVAGKTLVAANEGEIVRDGKSDHRKHRGEQKAQKFSVLSDQNSASSAIKKASKTDMARLVGKLLAQKALRKKIKTVVFDRRGYKYHGRVKALAEAARKGGLVF